LSEWERRSINRFSHLSQAPLLRKYVPWPDGVPSESGPWTKYCYLVHGINPLGGKKKTKVRQKNGSYETALENPHERTNDTHRSLAWHQTEGRYGGQTESIETIYRGPGFLVVVSEYKCTFWIVCMDERTIKTLGLNVWCLIEFCRLEMQPVMLVFSTPLVKYCPSNLLTGSPYFKHTLKFMLKNVPKENF
jgi:hypothetical protein